MNNPVYYIIYATIFFFIKYVSLVKKSKIGMVLYATSVNNEIHSY